MKATGIVRRIDELGRVVIPKEIRRTQRIRRGQHLRREALNAWCAARLSDVFGKFIFNAPHAGFTDGKFR